MSKGVLVDRCQVQRIQIPAITFDQLECKKRLARPWTGREKRSQRIAETYRDCKFTSGVKRFLGRCSESMPTTSLIIAPRQEGKKKKNTTSSEFV